MQRIVVCVCTLNRPSGLRALLKALDLQRLCGLGDFQVSVIVVDNSSNGSAAVVVQDHVAHARFSVRLVHEPRRGLANARNAALVAAREAGAIYLVFIDDDEVPSAGWLEALVVGLQLTNAAAAIGPVSPIFETPPGRWLPLAAYEEWRQPRKGFVEDGYTANAILKLSAIEAHGVAFDARFNETGGEDTLFFKQVNDRGLNIAWAEDAVVYALIPHHRMSVSWLWRRWYRTGMVEAHLSGYDPAGIRGRAFNLIRGIARVVAGSARVFAEGLLRVRRRPDAVVFSMYTLCRGTGLIANAFGREYREYARPDYR